MALPPQAPTDQDAPRDRGEPKGSLTRRDFMQGLGLTGAAAAVGVGSPAHGLAAGRPDQGPDSPDATVLGPEPIPVTLSVNGATMKVTLDPATTLLEALRHRLDLTGSKEICDRGACGGCSVLVDGSLVASCMMLAVDAEGARITTIEGLAAPGELHPLQEAFVRHDALQCGYCTPGLVVACKALLDRHPRPTMEQIRQGLSGNICRCGTYTNIFNAVLEASGQEVPTDPRPLPVAAKPTEGAAP